MGTTPAFGLPYPDGSSLVIEGDDAIQALAERVAVLLTPAYAIAPAAASAPQLDVTGATPATFDGLFGSGQVTLESGSTIRYTGPSRWFLVDAEVQASMSGATTVSAYATLVVDGSAVAGTDKFLELSGSDAPAVIAVLRISTPILLHDGAAVQLIIEGADGASGPTFSGKQFRIVSIGAPQ